MPKQLPEADEGQSGSSAPALVIRLELEAAAVVYVDTLNDGEEARLTDWLTEARPDLGELAARAIELADKGRAA